MASRLLVGLGNRLRGDDAVGLEIADALEGAVALEGEPVDLIELWGGYSDVVIVDAVAGDSPGRVHRLDGREGMAAWRGRSPASSHAIGLAQVVELASALDRLPARLVVIGIEGRRFDAGAEPQPAVREAARALIAELAGDGDSVASTPAAS